MEASEREQWKAFYAATGQMIIMFASLETYLSACLRFNLTWKIDAREWGERASFAAAVYGSQRFKASRDTVKRIVDQESRLSPDQTKTLKGVMEHFAHIANLRDKLAHQHTSKHPLEPATWLISDTFSTRNFNGRQTWSVTTKAINAATRDLNFGRKCLGDHNASGTLFKSAPCTPPAWRYKSSELALLDPETVRALRGQPPPPQS